jgi:hypothetical protein
MGFLRLPVFIIILAGETYTATFAKAFLAKSDI